MSGFLDGMRRAFGEAFGSMERDARRRAQAARGRGSWDVVTADGVVTVDAPSAAEAFRAVRGARSVSPAVVWQSTEVVDRANDPGWRERAEMDDLHASPFA
jgi:hypothetical protein